ncbi:MAG: DUF2934 domain-containing protein [Bacteroidales bacterium]|nr:DUF2934 domain-containing protein [Bacteroidales bacterium]
MGTKKASPTSKVKSSATGKKKITEEHVRKLAQKIYESRINKGTPGNAESDWLQAEKELNGVK